MRFIPGTQRGFTVAVFSISASLLHSLCCFLPLYTSLAVTFGESVVWNAARPYLLAVQIIVFLYCIIRIFAMRRTIRKATILIISAFIGIIGLVLGIRDTFRSPIQVQTLHVLDNLKYQESVALLFEGAVSLPQVKHALGCIRGVKSEYTEWDQNIIIVHYHSGIITEAELLQALFVEGYLVKKHIDKEYQ